jgi:hypothetical protein
VPVIVNVRVAVVALLFTVTVKVEVPEPVTEVGLKVPVTPILRPIKEPKRTAQAKSSGMG